MSEAIDGGSDRFDNAIDDLFDKGAEEWFSPDPLGKKREQAPEQVGRFEIIRELGRGGQATVYLARDSHLERLVALKILSAPLLDGDAQRRFEREARVASRLNHEGICAVYDAGVHDGQAYIAMRYVDGESLSRRVHVARERGSSLLSPTTSVDLDTVNDREENSETTAATTPSGPRRRKEIDGVLQIIEKAAHALDAAHESGVVHRDVKPANILLTDDGSPVISDFGLAHADEASEISLTRTGDLFGTPAYMSPEQITRKSIRVDRRTDVWALGATLYECLTLRRPFEAPTRQALYQTILTEDPPDPQRVNPTIPKQLKVVIETALEKSPQRRYQSAADLAEDLRRVRNHEPILAKPVGHVGRLLRWTQRRPYRAASVFLLFVLVAASSWYVAKGPEREAIRGKARQKDAADLRLRVEAQVEELLQAGFLAIHEDAPREGLDHLEQALALAPDDQEAIGGKVLALARLNRNDEAWALVSLHVSESGRPAGLAYLRAWVSRRLERDERDNEDLPDPETAADHFLIGYLKTTDRAKSDRARAHSGLHDLGLAAAMSSPRCLYFVHRARVAGGLKNAWVAKESATVLAMLWPQDPYAWWGVGHARFADDQREAKREAFEKALELRPEFPLALPSLSNVLRKIGRVDEALKIAERATGQYPHMLRAWQSKAEALSKLGRFKKAVAAWDRCLQIEPHHWAWADKGDDLRFMGQFEDAITAYDESLKLDQDRFWVWNNKAVCLVKLGRDLEALYCFQQAAAKGRNDEAAWRLYNNLGLKLLGLGRPEEALDAFESALERKSDACRLWCNKGRAQADLERHEDALKSYDRALVFADDHSSHERRTTSLIALERFDEAAHAASESVRTKPDCPTAHGLVLQVAWERHEYGDVLVEVRRWVALDSNDPTRQDHLAMQLLDIGNRDPDLANPEAAVAAAKKAVALTKEQDPKLLKTLARALGAADQREAAIRACEKALTLIEKQDEPDAQLKADLEESLRRYNR